MLASRHKDNIIKSSYLHLLGCIIPDANDLSVLSEHMSQQGYRIISTYDLLLAFLAHQTRASACGLIPTWVPLDSVVPGIGITYL